MVMIRK